MIIRINIFNSRMNYKRLHLHMVICKIKNKKIDKIDAKLSM